MKKGKDKVKAVDEYAYQPKRKKYKYGTIVPLIGGMSVGNSIATGHNPDFFISYPAFNGNDQHIRKYMPEVPYLLLDPETNDFMESTEEMPDINKSIDSETFEGVDFISAVCPCAGLSMMNASQKEGSKTARGSDAAQNQWMYKSAEFVLEKIRPQVFFGENAPGLYTSAGKGVVEKLQTIAKEHGYTLSLYKTNTIYHGIPQKRERTFYFFWKGDSDVPIFTEYRREHPSLVEFLDNIPKSASMNDAFPGLSEKGAKVNPYINFIKHREGKNWREAVKNIKTAANYLARNKACDEMLEWVNETTVESEKAREKTIKFLEHMKNKMAMGKGWWDSTPHFFHDEINAVIGRTITSTIHPREERGLSVREVLHLMGLPHDFDIPDVKYYNHAAQNVPTCTARDVTYEVIKYIDGKLKLEPMSFIKQSNSSKRLDTPLKAKKLF
jgi:site-specific DNA-cytosine methylase